MGIQSASWGVAPVIAQTEGPRGVGNGVGGVVEASAGEWKSKSRYKRNLRHGLPQFRRPAPFFLHVWFTNIVQRVAGVCRMGVEAAEVYPEDCRQEISVDIMMWRRATWASYAPAGSAPHSCHSTRSWRYAYPAAKPVPSGTMCYPYFTQSYNNLF